VALPPGCVQSRKWAQDHPHAFRCVGTNGGCGSMKRLLARTAQEWDSRSVYMPRRTWRVRHEGLCACVRQTRSGRGTLDDGGRISLGESPDSLIGSLCGTKAEQDDMRHKRLHGGESECRPKINRASIHLRAEIQPIIRRPQIS
jgi:hypothetical protein